MLWSNDEKLCFVNVQTFFLNRVHVKCFQKLSRIRSFTIIIFTVCILKICISYLTNTMTEWQSKKRPFQISPYKLLQICTTLCSSYGEIYNGRFFNCHSVIVFVICWPLKLLHQDYLFDHLKSRILKQSSINKNRSSFLQKIFYCSIWKSASLHDCICA